MGDILKKLPDSETVWERIHEKQYAEDEAGPIRFVITSDRRREAYYIYEVHHDGIMLYERLGKAKNPPELWRKFGGHVRDICGYKEVTEDG